MRARHTLNIRGANENAVDRGCWIGHNSLVPHKQPTITEFFRAFGANCFTQMSGPLTVPFTMTALFVPSTWLKALFAILAILCGASASYGIWTTERKQLISEEAEVLRLRMTPDIAGEILAVFVVPTKDEWKEQIENEFGDHPRDGWRYHLDGRRYYLRVRLVNRNEVPCTLISYRLHIEDERPPIYSESEELCSPEALLYDPPEYRDGNSTLVISPFLKGRTVTVPLLKPQTDIPLERGRHHDGWISFFFAEYRPAGESHAYMSDEMLHEHYGDYIPPGVRMSDGITSWRQDLKLTITDSLEHFS